MSGQLPLPGAPATGPARATRTRTGPSYIRFKAATPILCEDCTRAIHRLGIARAPFPSKARWKRIGADGEATLLCAPCKDTRKDAER